MSDGSGGSGLSPEQQRALAGVLDVVIPPSEDGRLPGAGEAGIAEGIWQNVPDLRAVIVQGLAALGDLAAARGAGVFAELSEQAKRDVLNELAATQPAFLPGLIFQTYVSYYQNARVVEALGLEARPPHPAGYDLEEGDLTLLDAVRQRPKRYREC